MSKFKPADFRVKEEKGDEVRTRVVKLNSPVEPGVRSFAVKKFEDAGPDKYSQIKAKYGPLAVTDPDRAAKKQKDSRFSLNPLVRDPLSVEEEERRVIEERVRDRVAAVAAEVKKQAEVEGYQAGLKKGYAEAFEKFQTEGAERLSHFTELLASAESAKEQIFRANERFILDLVYKIARMVLLKELSADKEYVLRLARDLVERVGVKENITIRISQADADTAGMLKEGLERVMGDLKNLNIQVSNQIRAGGCIVETEWNAIDASVETQLEGIYESLIGGESKA